MVYKFNIYAPFVQNLWNDKSAHHLIKGSLAISIVELGGGM
jgi:hypothetical protein